VSPVSSRGGGPEPEHPATSRAGHYAVSGGPPVFSRTLLREVRAKQKRVERERAQAEARMAAEPTQEEA
jgi:hypothetical protein